MRISEQVAADVHKSHSRSSQLQAHLSSMKNLISIVNTESDRTKRGKVAHAILSYYANEKSRQARLNREALLEVEEEIVIIPHFIPPASCRKPRRWEVLQMLRP